MIRFLLSRPECRSALSAVVMVCFLSAGLSTRLRAHDLWIVPPEASAKGTTIQLRALSGMDFPVSVNASDPSKYKLRVLILPDGSEGSLDAAGVGENVGLLDFETKNAGIYVVGIQTEPKLITLEADEFNAYLVSDGLPHIYRLRSEEKILDQAGRERYSKSPKALIQVGTDEIGDPSKVVGLPLEIVPLDNPFKLKIGNTLRVRVLFQGQPLPDANLGWDRPGDGEPPSGTVRSNSDGEALIPIQSVGMMTIRLTHMIRPKAEDYEWESFWTTLTFRIPK